MQRSVAKFYRLRLDKTNVCRGNSSRRFINKRVDKVMKKTEKIIVALLTIALGILVVVLRGDLIKILTSVFAVALLVFGAIDLLGKRVPPAVVKLVAGIVVLVCGLALVEIVLYVIAAFLLVAGILILYEKLKIRRPCISWQVTLFEYALPVFFVVVGCLLLFNQGNTVNWIFVVCGVLTMLEGGLLLINALMDD